MVERLRRILEDSDFEDDLLDSDEENEDAACFLEMNDIAESIEAIHHEIQNSYSTNRRSRSLQREQVRRRARNRSVSPFAWQSNVSNLTRKLFTGHVEPTRHSRSFDGDIKIFKIFRHIINDEVLRLIVHYTNMYGSRMKESTDLPSARINRWKEVDDSEMLKFIGVIILTGLIKFPTMESYWKMDEIYYHPLLHKIGMSYNRFILLLKCWHFCDNDAPRDEGDRLYKISPLLNLIIQNCRSIYTPGEVIVVDESMVHFRGRLLFRQYLPSKAHKYGIKIYKICTVDGYTWGYKIYCGQSNNLHGLDKPGSVVVELAEDLLDEGRCIVTDNYYTSIPLAEYLLSRNTDLCGTLKLNRKGVPRDIVNANLEAGQIAAMQKQNEMTVLKWKDKRAVTMLSTCHGHEMSLSGGRAPKIKPKMIIDYNLRKKGIDVADQLSSYHGPVRKSIRWYKKVAVDLITIAVVNSTIIYNEMHPRHNEKLTILKAQEEIFRALIHGDPELRTPSTSGTNPTREQPYLSGQSSEHKLEHITKVRNRDVRRRCVSCYKKLNEQGKSVPYARIMAKKVTSECKKCGKALCLPCFNYLHK